MKEYFSKKSSKISYFPVFPTLAKFGVFPRTVITGNYHWEFPPPVFPGQPCSEQALNKNGNKSLDIHIEEWIGMGFARSIAVPLQPYNFKG